MSIMRETPSRKCQWQNNISGYNVTENNVAYVYDSYSAIKIKQMA